MQYFLKYSTLLFIISNWINLTIIREKMACFFLTIIFIICEKIQNGIRNNELYKYYTVININHRFFDNNEFNNRINFIFSNLYANNSLLLDVSFLLFSPIFLKFPNTENNFFIRILYFPVLFLFFELFTAFYWKVFWNKNYILNLSNVNIIILIFILCEIYYYKKSFLVWLLL